MTTRLLLLLTLAISAGLCHAVEPVRVGLLKFGTVNWEMAVVQDEGLDQKHGVDVQVTELASTNAVNVALQGGAVDLIVGDWIWVNRQRAEGRDYSFFPYSLAVGGRLRATRCRHQRNWPISRDASSASPVVRWTRAGSCCKRGRACRDGTWQRRSNPPSPRRHC